MPTTTIRRSTTPERLAGAGPSRPGTRARVLLLVAETGGGHRAGAEALREALELEHGDSTVGIVVDPLTGPRAPRLARSICNLYGPLVRFAPWLWALLFHGTNRGPVRPVLEVLVTRIVRRTLRAEFEHHEPAVVVAAHPLLVAPAVACRARGTPRRVITVVTDTGSPHRTWWHRGVDHLVVSRPGLAAATGRSESAPPREHVFGLPVRRRFVPRCPGQRSRAAVRADLGLGPDRFVVLVSGGGEGVRGTERWARAVVAGRADVDVVLVAGRNERLRRRSARLRPRPGRRLVVTGFVEDLGALMRACDVLVTKAGPSIIAEAAAAGLPVLVAGHLPGQEAGNGEEVERAGAGFEVRSTRDLVARVTELSRRPDVLADLRRAARRSSKPRAGARTAGLIAELVEESR